MATRMWNAATEGDVWFVEPENATEDEQSSGYSCASDTDSTTATMETIESNEVEGFFREEYGRAFPIYEELPMALPSDAGEIHRLQIQHSALKLLVGDTLDRTLEAHLVSSPDGRRRRVLDVRTQTGLWAEEVAINFPNVDVKTIDVAPTIPHLPRANLHHEVYDVHAGIMEADESFDVVHARHTVNMIKDWRTLLQDIHRVLRPGGLLIFGELDPRLTAPEDDRPASHGPASRSARFFEEYRVALSSRGVLVETYKHIDNWLAPDNPLWRAHLGSGFGNIVHRVWEAPLNGLWHPDPLMQEVGMLMAMNFCEFIGNARPLFLSSGITDSEFDRWVEDMRKEVRDPMNNVVIRYHAVCAYKL
ncbi:hypothetical protein FRC08_004247 [Ceratobasidium sp. 394]|nr:hypothetical protein FRC08_004247 [Ceratobasidium sp. 394]